MTQEFIDANIAVRDIRKALRERSGKTWSVKRGTGTSYGWISISSPPARRDQFGSMTDVDAAELHELLGLDNDGHAISVPSSSAYRREYIDRAEGREPSINGTPYWD